MQKELKIISLFLVLTLTISAQDVFDAARKGNLARMEALVKIKPDTLNSRNENGFTPLILAVYRNQVSAVEFLLKQKVEVNATSPEGTALLAACYKGNIALAEMLINYKGDVNSCNPLGTSALMYAALANNVGLVKLLLKNGARKDLKEKSGKTALDYAKANQSEEMIGLLSN